MCRLCGHELAVYDGIPDFAEHIALADPALPISQKVMNSRLFAAIYESAAWRPLHTRLGSGITMKKETQQVIEMSRRDSAQVIADLACGTGHYARKFASVYPEAHVYGLDISLRMLARGQEIVRRKGLTAITFIRGDIKRLPFDYESVDIMRIKG